jgi:aryl-alcohol dehydrogenase-like predicted oxidoreductase
MPNAAAATKAYKDAAAKHGVSVTALALQWVYSRPHVASTIVGATSEAQLREVHHSFERVCCITLCLL